MYTCNVTFKFNEELKKYNNIQSVVSESEVTY